MISETYEAYSVSLDLLEDDGYGPLEHRSQLEIEELILAKIPPLRELYSKANTHAGLPSVINTYLDHYLFLKNRITFDHADFVNGLGTAFNMNFPTSGAFEKAQYFGGCPHFDTSLSSEWIDFSGSVFDIVKGIQVRCADAPKPKISGVSGSTLEEIQSHRPRQYPLDKIVPRFLSLNLTRFPIFFEFDGTVFFRETVIEQWLQLGRLGMDRTATECVCCLKR